jgi:GNAT superfamily N-acetyltransferase
MQSPSSYLTADTAIMSTEAPQAAQPRPDELPPLSTYTAESEDDRVDGLRLVADSVAQQRQLASKILIFHPINLAAFFLVIAVAAQRLYTDTDSLYLIATTVGGLTMAFLVAVRWATARYLALAEEINWEWLGEDKLIVVKWGEEVIGSLVLGWADNDAAKKPRGGRRRRGKAVVRAWTVRTKYRGKGVGEGLLEEAVKVAGERGADGILFEADHASKFLSMLRGLLWERMLTLHRLATNPSIDIQRIHERARSEGGEDAGEGCG